MSAESSDLSLPFLLEAGAIRGRLVRLGPALDSILAGHDYPPPVAERLAETLVLAAALAGGLKYDGIFTLQIQAQGAVSLLVADVTSDGALRGYARFDAARLAQAEAVAGPPVPRLLGEGYLAFTVDPGADSERYQGIVALSGDTLADCVEGYFRQSEQMETALLLAVRPPRAGLGWQAAALTVQRMPGGPQSPILTAEHAEESWRRAAILLRSARDSELFDPALPPRQLLHRLYHAEPLAFAAERPLRAQCRCSPERVAGTLRSFLRREIEAMKNEQGEIVVVCEFCKATTVFTEADLDRLYMP